MKNNQVFPVLVFASTALIASGIAASAQSQSQGGTRQLLLASVQTVCRDDIEHFCKEAQPGDKRATKKCMKSHEADLSSDCRNAVLQVRQMKSHAKPNGSQPQ